MSSLGRGFDSVADLYDEARPRYPRELYGVLETATGGLAGRRVLDLAAGTGIATRALRERGADVTALDPGREMIRRLRAGSPDVPSVLASAEQIPCRTNVFDLVTCATAWHWLDPARAVAEVRRVVTPGGHLALWWANNRWGDGVAWEEAQSAVYDRWETGHGSRPALHAGVGPRDAAADLRARGLEVVEERTLRWSRERSAEDHVRALATHSDVIALGGRKEAFLDDLRAALAPWPVLTERLWGPLVIARV